MADGMNTIPDPRDPNIIYYNGHFGDITRIDLRNREERYIQPYPPGPQGGGANSDKYRFNWNAPMLMSPSDPDVVYFGGNVLFRTNDGGTTWKIISPDLTTNDPEKQKLSGGPIDPDNTRAEFYCTITAIAENPADRNVLWVGTDDGNVQLSRDAGAHWTNVAGNIRAVTPGGWITSIAASYKDPATAYVAIDRHQFDDFAPYVFVTHDFGKTWSKITDALSGYAHIIAEDPKQPSLLYTGTELGIFASFDQGKTWTDLRLGLPRLPVYDLKVHPRDNDLIIATHARGFYILDDVTPLQQLAAASKQRLVLFQPYRATRYIPASDTSELGNGVWVARNKPYGAIITYFVSPALAKGDPVHLTVLDSSGKVLHTSQGPSSSGLNRVVWDLRGDVPCFAGAGDCKGWQDRSLRGVRVLPGEYKVRVEAFGQTAESPFQVRVDPRLKVSDQDLSVYDRESRHVVSLMYSIDEALARIRNVQEQLRQVESRTTDSSIRTEAKEAQEQLKAVRVDLQPDPRDPEHLNLKQRLSWMLIQVPNYTGRPTPAQVEWISTLDREIQQVLKRLDGVLSGSVARLNSRLEQDRTPYISTVPEPASQTQPADEGLDLD
jgi:hypothetical protein